MSPLRDTTTTLGGGKTIPQWESLLEDRGKSGLVHTNVHMWEYVGAISFAVASADRPNLARVVHGIGHCIPYGFLKEVYDGKPKERVRCIGGN